MSTAEDNAAARVVLAVNFNHDGAGVLLVDGRIGGFVCTERRSRLKKHPGLRAEDLDELLDQAGVSLADVDHVLLCNLHNMDSPDVPHLHGSDLKDTWFEFWLNQRNDRVRIRDRTIPCTVNPDHHLIHAAAAYYTSPFDAGVSLAIDPLGCRAFAGRGNRLYPLRRGYDDWFTANIGYTSVAEMLFGTGIVGAGKVMGLAPYGRTSAIDDADWKAVSTFAELLALAATDPVTVRVAEREVNASLAYAIQLGLERQLSLVLDDLGDVCRRNNLPAHLCLSGGTALNAIANQTCFTASTFDRLHLHPACGDDGTALGAALWYWHHVLGRPRQPFDNAELMYGRREYPPARTAAAVDAAVAAHPGLLTVDRPADHVHAAADLISASAVVGWYDGASEVGPRALGHRSMLADPRSPTVRDRLNSEVKYRESFRPFAPSVLNEHAGAWFGLTDSPFMLRACPVLRDGVPAITHVDGTSRIQTVTRRDNPPYHALLRRFHELTGVPMVLNTSLNTRGRPIDETPEDALDTLVNTNLDYLVFPGVIVGKRSR
ncbi:carbamoyltransferase C-terminal domain-containing protein [Micromonospora sp. NPDC051296]|uniref:carbamoyltransferase C-terminal domain-containing protein n=1 Tax=Micromonospora sp. NPDC051296 TaxID=3155046 RepID=UPI00342CD32C